MTFDGMSYAFSVHKHLNLLFVVVCATVIVKNLGQDTYTVPNIKLRFTSGTTMGVSNDK